MHIDCVKQILSIPGSDEILAEYSDSRDLRQSYEQYGCMGLELIRCGTDSGGVIQDSMICGVHMLFYPLWLDFYLKDEKALQQEFGGREVWEDFYRGKDFSCVMEQLRQDLEFAHKVKAEYVVFHVSDVTIEGVFTYRHHRRDEEVIEAACSIINELLDGKGYNFHFLVENLWWPGFTMTNPKCSVKLLEGIHYGKKGIMLDTGHLLCSNLKLRTQEEGCGYISRILDDHEKFFPDFCSYIKGIHLHQSISGEYVKEVLENPPVLREGYCDRFAQVYEHLGRVDTHSPWELPEIRRLVERIRPEFLVHELQAKDRRDREGKLKKQAGWFMDSVSQRLNTEK